MMLSTWLSQWLHQELPPFIDLLSFTILLMALALTTSKTVHRMVPLYQAQSYILAFVTFLTAIEPDNNRHFTRIIVLPVLLVPVFLALSIKALLAQATVSEDIPIPDRLRRLLSKEVRRETRLRAMP